MTKFSVRVRLAVEKSTIPEKAIISAIEEAGKPKASAVETPRELTNAEREQIAHDWLRDHPPAPVEAPRRPYRRRDMRAE